MKDQHRPRIIDHLTTPYRMEMGAMTNYVADYINLDGVRAEEIKKSLAADVTSELMHTQSLAKLVKELGGYVPGSRGFNYGRIIELCGDAHDYVTQDLCITALADEEGHRTAFIGYLKEYSRGQA